jgi:hypothetical protein
MVVIRMELLEKVLADQVREILVAYPLTKTMEAMRIVRSCHQGD